MKIVMIYTKGYRATCRCEKIIPIEHESLESAFFEFDEAYKASNIYFKVFGIEFCKYSFKDDHPRFLTIEEWFATKQ